MPPKPPADPTKEPVLVTAVGFDLFGPDHVVLTVRFLADINHIDGPQEAALFVFQADQLKAIGAKFSEAADLSAGMKSPMGNA